MFRDLDVLNVYLYLCNFFKNRKDMLFPFLQKWLYEKSLQTQFSIFVLRLFHQKVSTTSESTKRKNTSSNVRWNVLVEVEAFYSAIDFLGAEEVYGFMPKKACNGLLIHPRQFFISLLTKTGMFGYSFKSFSRCVCWEVKLMIYETWNPVDFPKCHFCSWRFK